MAQPTTRSARPSPVRPSSGHNLSVVTGAADPLSDQAAGPTGVVISLDAARTARRAVLRAARTRSRSRGTHLRLVELAGPTPARPILRLVGCDRESRPALEVLADATGDGPRVCSICGEEKAATAFRGRAQRCTVCRPAHQPGW